MCVLVPLPPPVALVCSCVFSLFSIHRTRRTHLHSPSTKELQTRLSPLLKHLPCRTPDIYTPLPLHQATKHKHRNNMKADLFLISPFEAIAVVCWGLPHSAPVFSFPRFHFRGCGCEQHPFPFFVLGYRSDRGRQSGEEN
jgi:hypothetical protein